MANESKTFFFLYKKFIVEKWAKLKLDFHKSDLSHLYFNVGVKETLHHLVYTKDYNKTNEPIWYVAVSLINYVFFIVSN